MWMTSALAVHRRILPVRCGLVGQLAHRLPRPAGAGWRHDPAHRPVDGGPRRRSATHRPCHERRRRAHRPGPDPRPGARWPDRLQLQLALDLLHQRPHRHRHPRPLQQVPGGTRRGSAAVSTAWASPFCPPAWPRSCTRCRRWASPASSPARPSSSASCSASALMVAFVLHALRVRNPLLDLRTVQEPQFHHLQYLHVRHGGHPLRLDVHPASLLPDRPGAKPMAGRTPDGSTRHRCCLDHAKVGQNRGPGRAAQGSALRHLDHGRRHDPLRLRHRHHERCSPGDRPLRPGHGVGAFHDAHHVGRLLRPVPR